MQSFKLPDYFLLGSATAASQIEGFDPNTNWAKWHSLGKIENNDSPLISSGHFKKVKEDIALMRELNQQTYRFSVEWSRIEPKEGEFSKEGLDYYIDEIKHLNAANIKPLLTLHHFSQPQWFEEMGQWTNKKSVYYFLRFAEHVVKEIAPYVSEYCTINEPNVYLMGCFIEGSFPPGKKDDVLSYFKAGRNLIKAHIKAYKMIHSIRAGLGFYDTKVGYAMNYAYLESDKTKPLTKISKKYMDYLFHGIFEKGFINGRLVLPLGLKKLTKGSKFCDFLGINYYTRYIVYPGKNSSLLFGDPQIKKDIGKDEKSDMGWEIYPEGLYKTAEKLSLKYPQLPIYITENGIADADDKKRAGFIAEHLYIISRLIEKNVKIQRYYYWSTMDNLEWNSGFWPRFGLIEIDYNSLERKIRKSARFYADIIKNRGLTDKMIEGRKNL